MKYKRLSTQKLNKIILCFCENITASATAKLAAVNRRLTPVSMISDIKYCSDEKQIQTGEFKADESYFGAHRGRGAAGKVAVFGILKRQSKVYTVIVDNTKTDTLLPVIREKIMPDRKGNNHINGIENFWNQAKRVLRKYNGINRKSFPLFLKECEFRFNYGSPKEQLKILRSWCGF